MSASIDASGLARGERAGVVVMGRDTASIAVQRNSHGLVIVRSTGKSVDTGGVDEEAPASAQLADVLPPGVITLRATFEPGGRVRLDALTGSAKLVDAGAEFIARPGVWVGARIGLFASRQDGRGPELAARGFADVDWFRVEPRAAGRLP